ncbi:MAG: M23 family metallopeptidase [Acidobacteriota bacterium]
MENSFPAKKLPWASRIGIFSLTFVSLAGVAAAERELRRSAELPLPALPIAFEKAAEARALSFVAARPVAEVSLKRGQTLSDALVGLGLDNAAAQVASQAALRYVDPRSLQPGDRFLAFGASGSERATIEVALNGRGQLRLDRKGESWSSSWRPCERSVRVRTLDGVLSGSLEGSIRTAGGNPMLAYRMSDVLQWDLDFNRDLQPGDRFSVLYEDVTLDGVPTGPGAVLALRYSAGSRKLEAYRFGAADYYDAEGRPLRKMFLKSPLPYSRVTSRFSTQRFHPILKKVVPHWGIDLGAPIGTPVRATASGVVLSAGWDGGGGKAIKIRHPSGYITGYLHLSRFAPEVHAGARVGQGDVIGFVGQTGLATGPHLDYRVQLRGSWLDPMSLKAVEAPVIAQKELPDFKAWRDSLRASLTGSAALPTAPSRGKGLLPARREAPDVVAAAARR